MRIQAGVVGNIDSNRTQMSNLVSQSQGSQGALQATQAGNQLLALQSQQLSDLIALISANGRATALTDAERAAAAKRTGLVCVQLELQECTLEYLLYVLDAHMMS